jgi:hypothetical protein
MKTPKFRIWDKVVRDLRFYESKNKWKILDYEIVTKIWTNEEKVVMINNIISDTYRLATKEEIKLYY